MSTKEDVKLQRGTKRMCQNPECGSRFYDLNRDPITCPVCRTIYEIRVQPVSVAPARPTPRPVKKPAPFVPDEVKPDVPVEEGEEGVADPLNVVVRELAGLGSEVLAERLEPLRRVDKLDLAATVTGLALIAALAIIGFKRSPNTG